MYPWLFEGTCLQNENFYFFWHFKYTLLILLLYFNLNKILNADLFHLIWFLHDSTLT